MIGILNISELLFVKDMEGSDWYFEIYRAEADLRSFVLKVDKTFVLPYYELFEEWKEEGRILHRRLSASSTLSEVLNWKII